MKRILLLIVLLTFAGIAYGQDVPDVTESACTGCGAVSYRNADGSWTEIEHKPGCPYYEPIDDGEDDPDPAPPTIVTPPPAPPPPVPTTSTYTLNEQGIAAYRNRDWLSAIYYFKEALKLSPNDAVIRQNLKDAELQESAHLFRHAQAIDLKEKGIAAFRNENWAEAISYYQEALKLFPEDATIQQNLKDAELQESTRQQQELAHQQQLAETLILNDKGIAAFRDRDWMSAINFFKEALKLSPSDAVIRQNLQNAEQNLKDSKLQELAHQKQLIKEQEAKRQHIFNERKAELLGSLMGDSSSKLELLTDTPVILPILNPAKISNPQISRIATNLNKITVPPLPAYVSKAWYEFLRPATEKSKSIMFGVDCALLAWDIAGHIGKGAASSYTVTLIAGKTIIAGAEGGLVFMTEKNDTYERALNFLKESKTAKQFSQMVWELKEKGAISKQSFQMVGELREKGTISAREYKDMIEAAKTVADEKNSRRLFWDAMLSSDALAAMANEAMMEIGTTLFLDGSTSIGSDLVKRKAIFKSIRLERNLAVSKLRNTKIPAEIEDLKRVIAHANKQLSLLFHVEGAGPKIIGFLAGQESSEETKK